MFKRRHWRVDNVSEVRRVIREKTRSDEAMSALIRENLNVKWCTAQDASVHVWFNYDPQSFKTKDARVILKYSAGAKHIVVVTQSGKQASTCRGSVFDPVGVEAEFVPMEDLQFDPLESDLVPLMRRATDTEVREFARFYANSDVDELRRVMPLLKRTLESTGGTVETLCQYYNFKAGEFVVIDYAAKGNGGANDDGFVNMRLVTA